ncbi:PAS fold, partial [Pelosinus fermentans]
MYLRILYIDRIGVVHDITAILAKRRINIVSMEVEKNKIYLECQSVSEQQCKECIAELSCITGIQRINEISAMPSKERAEQLDAILTSVHDGILSVNPDGLIAQYNPAAARILNLPVKKAVGKP